MGCLRLRRRGLNQRQYLSLRLSGSEAYWLLVPAAFNVVFLIANLTDWLRVCQNLKC